MLGELRKKCVADKKLHLAWLRLLSLYQSVNKFGVVYFFNQRIASCLKISSNMTEKPQFLNVKIIFNRTNVELVSLDHFQSNTTDKNSLALASKSCFFEISRQSLTRLWKMSALQNFSPWRWKADKNHLRRLTLKSYKNLKITFFGLFFISSIALLTHFFSNCVFFFFISLPSQGNWRKNAQFRLFIIPKKISRATGYIMRQRRDDIAIAQNIKRQSIEEDSILRSSGQFFFRQLRLNK